MKQANKGQPADCKYKQYSGRHHDKQADPITITLCGDACVLFEEHGSLDLIFRCEGSPPNRRVPTDECRSARPDRVARKPHNAESESFAHTVGFVILGPKR